MKRMKQHLVLLAAGLVCSGGILPLALQPATAAAAEAPASADNLLAAKTKKLLVTRLAEAGVLDADRAAAIAAAPVQESAEQQGISVELKGGEPTFIVQPDLQNALTEKATSLQLDKPKAVAAEWFISAVAGACAEADLLLAVGPEKAASLPEETRRGLAFCMENNALNLLKKQKNAIETHTDADAPSGDTELVVHMVAGGGSELVRWDESTALFTPGYEALKAEKKDEAPVAKEDEDAPKEASAHKPTGSTVLETSAAFKKAVEELKPLSSPTDVEGFQAGLKSLLNDCSIGTKIIVHAPAKERPFDTLTPDQAAKSLHWYDGPKVTLDLDGAWVRYYAETVVPRLDAFYRSVAKDVETYDGECIIKPRSDGGLVLVWADTSWVRKVNSHEGNYSKFNILTPVHPEDFDRLVPNRRVKVKVTVYYLPKPFSAPYSGYNSRWQSAEVQEHIYDPNGKFLFNIHETYKWDLHYENELGWAYTWGMQWTLSEPVMPKAWFNMEKDLQYGGVLVTFNRKEDCFPELKQEKAQAAAKHEEEMHVTVDAGSLTMALLKDPMGLLLVVCSIIFLFSLPWMLWTIWCEYKRRLVLLPEEEKSEEELASTESEMNDTLSDFMQPVIDWKENMEMYTDEDGREYIAAKATLDKGFSLLHEVYRHADKMTDADRHYYNCEAEFLNLSQQRLFNGSERLLLLVVLAIVGSVAAAYFWHPLCLAYTAVALNYVLCLRCPFYKIERPAPWFVRGLRGLLAGLGIFGATVATHMLETKYVTIYRDNFGNLYRDTEEESATASVGLALYIFMLVVLVIGLPIFMIVDGSCNFLRNYIIQK